MPAPLSDPGDPIDLQPRTGLRFMTIDLTPPDGLATQGALTKGDFEALSEFRYRLRRFLNFSEAAARAGGITPQQYLLLLHVKGMPAREWASIGELAERLQAAHHSVVALVSRCEKAGLVERRPNADDRRVVEIHLLPAGETSLAQLAAQHRNELETFADIFRIRGVHL